MRRTRGLLGALLATAGLAVAADAVLTVVWQEPIGALRASAAQDDLGERYDALSSKYGVADVPSPAETVAPEAQPDPAAAARDARARALRVARKQNLLRARTARRLSAHTASGEPLGRLRIRRIGLSEVWVQGTNADALSVGPGHYTGTPLPGRRGTFALAGHRTTHGAPFRNIDRLRPGNRIDVSMPYGAYQYVVERTRIVSPDDVGVLRTAKEDRLVLTACHPLWSAKQRIVVTARLVRWPGMERLRAAVAEAADTPDDTAAADAPPPALLPAEPDA